MSGTGDLVNEYSPTGGQYNTRYPLDAFGQWTATGSGDMGYRAEVGPTTLGSPGGLIFRGARFYDTSTGRFLNRDPLGYGGGLNLYGYADDDPVNEVDPLGLNGFTDWYMGGMGGASEWLDNSILFSGATAKFAWAAGEYDSGCASGWQVAVAGNNWLNDAGSVATGIEGLGKAIAERGAAKVAQGGVYRLVNDAGEVLRTGRTKDLVARQAAHFREYPNLNFEVVFKTNDYAEQRGLEQMLHEQYEPTASLNKIRAISPYNPLYKKIYASWL